MSLLVRILTSFTVLFAVCGASTAREVVSLTNEFGVLRDFSNITFGAPDIPNAHVFVDTDRLVVSTLSASENAELHEIAINGLSSKLRLVKSKEAANYLIQIRMYQTPNYAIRNPQREYSQGFVMISICKFPIIKISDDCENMQYDYFQNRKFNEVFSIVLAMWLKATIPSE
jgi:hypothetical protein